MSSNSKRTISKNGKLAIIVFTIIAIAIGAFFIWLYYPSNNLSGLFGKNNKKDSDKQENLPDTEVVKRMNRDVENSEVFVTHIEPEPEPEESTKQISQLQDTPGFLITCDYVKEYDDLNGFLLKNTDALFVDDFTFNNGTMTGLNKDVHVTVDEVHTSEFDLDSARIAYLNDVGFQAYTSSEPLGIDESAEFETGGGLKDYQKYFSSNMSYDPTIINNYYLYQDCDVSTAMGVAKYIEWMDKDSGVFTAQAFIFIDPTRLISINITDKERGYLKDYLYDLTNSGITMVTE